MNEALQMGATHTPGPWRVRMGSTCSGAWPEIVPSDAGELDDELAQTGTAFVFDHDRFDRRTIAVTYNERPDCFVPTADGAESLANARLIAAAPDLLAACRALLALPGGPLGQAVEWTLEVEYGDAAFVAVDAMRAAIAKALGTDAPQESNG